MQPPRGDDPGRDELASRFDESVIAVGQTVVGQVLGAEAAIITAALSPFAKHAAKRLRGLTGRFEEAGLHEDALALLEEDEARARLVADVVRGTAESELAAKRALLALAAIRALQDLTVAVDTEQRLVRAANMLDTFDVRLLAFAGHPPDRAPDDKNPQGTLQPGDLESVWPEGNDLAAASLSTLIAAGLVERLQGFGDPAGWRITDFGRRLLWSTRSPGARGGASFPRRE